MAGGGGGGRKGQEVLAPVVVVAVGGGGRAPCTCGWRREEGTGGPCTEWLLWL